MTPKRLAFLLILIAGSLCIWRLYFSPEAVKRRAVAHTLEEMDATVATQDRTRIAAFLDKYLLPEATVTLNVSIAGGVYTQERSSMQETFSKPDFIRFIDLTLYSMRRYEMNSMLTAYVPQKNGGADVALHVNALADGDAYFNGFALQSRFVVEGDCSGTAVFDKAETPRSNGSNCTLTLRIVPRPGVDDFQHLEDTLNREQKAP